jgi:hypothetical protein
MSECDVCIGGEGEPIEDYSLTLTTSKLTLLCSECKRSIPRGVEHELLTGKIEGARFRARTCMDCRNIAEGLSCDGRIHSTLWDELEGSGIGDTYAAFAAFNETCVAKVKTASAKAYLVERWRKWKGLAT